MTEREVVEALLTAGEQDGAIRRRGHEIARSLAEDVRGDASPALTERLMATYSLTSREGRSLMELAEALLRVPDNATKDALLRDKIPGNNWMARDGEGLLRFTGYALSAAGMVIKPEHMDTLHAAVSRLGMPVIRQAVLSFMKAFGGQFVFAESIGQALKNAGHGRRDAYSFDMLGEGARTEHDAARYLDAYRNAIDQVGAHAEAGHGVSVKLSALYPRYEARQASATASVLYPRLRGLAELARDRRVPLTIDAEEMGRLDLSMEMFARLLAEPALAEWDGLGAVVQAYALRAGEILGELDRMAGRARRRVAVRLVKGAYWDQEIKIAQEKGLEDFPVYTCKEHTDLAYLALARQLLESSPNLLPQFATHNAATLGYVEATAQELGEVRFEVQRLHGMGERLHRAYQEKFGRPLRVYAPVGGHRDLLAYLVRRLLENAANSSFVHRIADPAVPVDELAAHPAEAIRNRVTQADIRTGAKLFGGERKNSRGWDLDDFAVLEALDREREPFRNCQWATEGQSSGARASPGNPSDLLLTPRDSTENGAVAALEEAAGAQAPWAALGRGKRAEILDRVAGLYEKNGPELFALLAREAGKTLDDAVAELREAADFCRYYAARLRGMGTEPEPRGVVLAISPWNFPLAIFTGQVAAALAVGNAVVAKPAEQTPLTAMRAVDLMHEAGVPTGAVRLAPGEGETVGSTLAGAGLADMAVFTGSTETARAINRAIAKSAKPCAPLLAETGGVNAMVVDSTALPERAVDDIVASAFRSAGQRCSALRALFVQEDIERDLLAMLAGAAELLRVGDPWDRATDIGPVIDREAKLNLDGYVAKAEEKGNLLWRGACPAEGNFVAPAIVRIRGMEDLKGEVFGPVLHVARFGADELGKTVEAINASGYGLTFGIQSRIRERQEVLIAAADAGNVYVNRNQVGAIVGSQPFGGRNLSGTGPKAGGPLYLGAFTRNIPPPAEAAGTSLMPGPDGEENRYETCGRGLVLCLASREEEARPLAMRAEAAGNKAEMRDKTPDDLSPYRAVMAAGDSPEARAARNALAFVDGPIIPLILDPGGEAWLYEEKHASIDTTAVGGNPQLLAR